MSGAVDVIDGAVEGRVGIPVSASGLDGICEFGSGEVFGAFEDHVFEEVRKASAEELVFVDATGFDPELGTNDRSGRIGVEDESEAVGQGLDVSRRKWESDHGINLANLDGMVRKKSMSRWIIIGIVIGLMGIAGAIGGYKVLKGNQKAPMWVPIVCKADAETEVLEKMVDKIHERLIEPAVLEKVCVDLKLAEKFEVGGVEQAKEVLKKRIFVKLGTHPQDGVDQTAILVGVSGKRKESELSGAIAVRMMDDVWKVLNIDPPPKRP